MNWKCRKGVIVPNDGPMAGDREAVPMKFLSLKTYRYPKLARATFKTRMKQVHLFSNILLNFWKGHRDKTFYSNSFNRQLDSLWNSRVVASWNSESQIAVELSLAISQFYKKAYCGLNCLTLKMGIEQLSIGHWSPVGFSSQILNQPCYTWFCNCFMLNSQSTALNW